MDLAHSINSHTADYRQYSLQDLNRNNHYNHHNLSQHNVYWQWQHSDGSSSDGFHQPSIFNANHWDSSSPPHQDAACTTTNTNITVDDLLPYPSYRTKSITEWNHPYLR